MQSISGTPGDPSSKPRIEGLAIEEVFKWIFSGSTARRNAVYFLVYTLLFLLVFRIGYAAFFSSGKSFVQYVDGAVQNFPSLLYLGEYYRGILESLFSGNLVIPLFDFNILYGENLLGMMSNQYGLGDPLSLLAAFVPVQHMEGLYNFLVPLRLYLAGMTFSAYCIYRGRSRIFSLAGALGFAFCGFALFTGPLHPVLTNPMILLPILLIGLDKVIEKEKPFLFIIAIGFAGALGYYFLYMLTLFMLVYAVFRSVSLYHHDALRETRRILLHTLLYYLLGFSLSAVISIPSILAFFGSQGRIVSPEPFLLTSVKDYIELVLYMVIPNSNVGWMYLTLPGVTILAVAMLFSRRTVHALVRKILVLLCVIAYLVPLTGYIFNGFSYITYRWTYSISFTFAYLSVVLLEEMQTVNKKARIWALGFILVYGLIVFSRLNLEMENEVTGFFILAISYLVVTLLDMEKIRKIFPHWSEVGQQRLRGICFAVLVVINVGVNATILYSASYSDYLDDFAKKGEVFTRFMDLPVNLLATNPKVEFYRVDSPDFNYEERPGKSASRILLNPTLTLDLSMLQAYISILNGNVTRSLTELGDAQQIRMFDIRGLDYRTHLYALSSMKYLVLESAQEDFLPFGFTPSVTTNVKGHVYTVYENQYSLPLGYTYATYLPEKTYIEFPPLGKQEVLLQTAVLEKGTDLVSTTMPQVSNILLPSKTRNVSGVNWKGHRLSVNEKNGQITVSFKGEPNSETYLRFKNLEILNPNVDSNDVEVKVGKITKTIRVLTDNYKYGYVNNDYLVNLGYREGGLNMVQIVFPNKENFSLDAIEVYSQPMEPFVTLVDALRAEPLEDITIAPNQISGKVDLSINKVLVVGVAYSKGWHARVDGVKTDIQRANGMFLGIPFKAGQHDIELTYFTPGLGTGIGLSLLGFLLLGFFLLRDRRQKS